MAANRFEVVDTIPEEVPAALPESNEPERAASLLFLALKALSQRAIVALADLFFMITALSAWWLWWSTPEPNAFQIASLTIYALFVLAANWIVRSRRG